MDLPTPPLPLATPMTLRTTDNSCRSASIGALVVGFPVEQEPLSVAEEQLDLLEHVLHEDMIDPTFLKMNYLTTLAQITLS
jgi:hypothetical protein